MSEIISNRGRHGHKTNRERQEQLKQIIKQLHEGKPVDEVRAQFEEAVGDVTVAEISALEQALIGEEGIPVEEVQRLCSVHTAVFKGSIQELHRSAQPEEQNGHPVHTFKLENRELERLLHFKLSLHMDRFMQDGSERSREKVLEDLKLMMEIDKHYSRKENLLFPYLEQYGIHGPTQVMWGVDDRIRADVKAVRQAICDLSSDDIEEREGIAARLRSLVQEMDEMIFKEENILLPMALQTLTEDEWVRIAAESGEIGYCFIERPAEWKPERAPAESEDTAISEGYIRLETGVVSLKQLELILNHLPVDITFIDEHDVVRYFSHGPDRLFTRTKSVIGRTVQNCHPPQSVHIVNRLLDDFKSGVRDAEDFWIRMKDKYVLIRYFAIRDTDGRYMGTLEFTQNIAPLQAIEGEKRIYSGLS
ncbi:DUF438 domain-containing protein [Paenibacillus melissococcoides]|uniref:DUF438 domain-containing protein n=1 Tax=Paenibacillus melissococcoides TaxID=2912268 RepID=A0ABM9GAT3_9BACL|nr:MULTISPECIES: DUF438 domain-containing protein [Paenibacillus]MEB9894639.1 DUF438 domain-containing protein [Bacillus cereus]CAH8248901.1 DUF438 domain-containing protein [Paenibacillus melissococcoides]CAH8720735.1 DUF438 domain-containing protein [Paenibacillus melissococcoides]CAH8720913.1 DUF438 domain-containing protein [Paenibacillus melissococcoides]GIO79233.1 hypothetical protein J6TS7_28430 [Paenibacillus dendritiformis]